MAITYRAVVGRELTNAEIDANFSQLANGSIPGFKQSGTDVERSWISKAREIVSVKDYGAVGDGVTDDTEAIQDAIDVVEEAGGGEILLPLGAYLTSAELVIDEPGVYLVGRGTGTHWDGLDNAASRIIGTHTTGSVIRIKAESCGARNLMVDANATRTAAARNTTAANYNAGIRVEASDVAAPEGDVFTTTLENVYVRNQPNDGIILVGRVYGSYLRNTTTVGNNGHGHCIDAGNRTGRTNVAPPGMVTIINGESFNNYGHGLAIGNSDDDADVLLPSFRCLVLNFDSFQNDIDSALGCDYDFDTYVRGDGNELVCCAFSGKNRAGTSQDHGALAMSGRGNIARATRYLDANPPGRVVVQATGEADGNVFDSMNIRVSDTTRAVVIDDGATNTKVVVRDTTSCVAATTDAEVGDDIQYANTRTVHGTYNVSDFRSGRELTIADDGVATYEFDTAGTHGVMVIGADVVAAGPCMVAFRVGNNEYVSLLGGDSSVVVGTTGELVGTTGTDGDLTISGHSDKKLYLENRTGGERTYTVTFLSMDGGRLLPGQ